jgi:hypothetical protein
MTTSWGFCREFVCVIREVDTVPTRLLPSDGRGRFAAPEMHGSSAFVTSPLPCALPEHLATHSCFY